MGRRGLAILPTRARTPSKDHLAASLRHLEKRRLGPVCSCVRLFAHPPRSSIRRLVPAVRFGSLRSTSSSFFSPHSFFVAPVSDAIISGRLHEPLSNLARLLRQPRGVTRLSGDTCCFDTPLQRGGRGWGGGLVTSAHVAATRAGRGKGVTSAHVAATRGGGRSHQRMSRRAAATCTEMKPAPSPPGRGRSHWASMLYIYRDPRPIR